MSEAENLFGEKHVQRYRETGGEVGHIWKRGSKTLLLTTKGRKTGQPSTTPLIYEEDDGRYVIVASKGGAPEHPGWYRNLAKEPQVELQVKDDVFPARARTASGEERERRRAVPTVRMQQMLGHLRAVHAGVVRDPGGNPQTDGCGGDRFPGRRGGSSYRKSLKRP